KKIAVFSDPHYFATELGTTGEAFEAYLAQDRKLIAESSAIARKTIDSLKTGDAGIVLVTGDLTKDGELLSHQQFAVLLKELEDSGKKVFVVAGNHDINNPQAFSYDGAQTTKVDHVTPEQFKQIYHDFGYGEAIARDPDSLSYVVEPVNGLRIISMDSVLYDTNLADGKPKTEGAFSEDRLTWIKEQIIDAVSQGKTVLGMMHHGLADHFTVQRQFFPEYVINDADRIADELAGAGMKAVFTGHFHAQDIVKKQTANGSVYDIETGSLITYPCPYRIIELTADNGLNISTSRIESIDYDLGGKDFPDYARDYLVEGLNGLVPQFVAGILIKQGVPADQALAQTEAKLSTPVSDGLTVKDLLVNALAGHYQGDEIIAPQLLPVMQAMAGSEDSLTRMIGQVLLSLGTDPTPADNDVTIDFLAAPVSNADLSSLLLSEGTLTPAFTPEVTRYEAVVGNSFASITVTPAAADSGATVKVNGNPAVSGAPFALNLAEGPNEITISVTAGDSTTKEYVVSITRRHVLPDSGRITLDNNKKNIEIPPAAQTAEITIPEGVQDATIHVPTSDNQGQKEAILPQLDVIASVRIGGAVAEIRVAVPAGTKVTGPAHWDGTIRMPEVLPNDSVQVSNGNVSAVVEIGLPDTKLAFDKAVRLLITGQAGKAAGFSRGGVFTPITHTLSADTQSAADAELTGATREGKVNAGG
ncbi:MAG TPA: hypothetical protein DCZ10_19995, partial [Pelotomaculum sp.]|nr:hypothetical protein [Pelotomaculum sp.]